MVIKWQEIFCNKPSPRDQKTMGIYRGDEIAKLDVQSK